MQSKNLTYILGAGASAQAVPVVRQLYDRMEFFIEQFKDSRYANNLREWINDAVDLEKLEGEPIKFYTKLLSELSKSEIRVVLVDKMEKILDEARSHQSIDTYAKMLFLQEENKKYNEAKEFISLFFLFEQIGFNLFDKHYLDHFIGKLEKKKSIVINRENFISIKADIDKRYDQFFAALLKRIDKDNPPILPKNLNLISWNYDLQVEMVLQKYAQIDRLPLVGSIYKIYPRWDTEHESSQKLAEDSSIWKINGTCGMVTDLSGWYFTSPIGNSIILPFLSILGKFIDPGQEELVETKPALSFAWDNDNSSPVFIQDICRDKIYNSSSIVIIGYSFPLFNRDIDKQLFSKLTNDSTIYIQDLPGMLNSVKHAAKSIIPEGCRVEIIPIDKVDQFYVPFEFVPEYS